MDWPVPDAERRRQLAKQLVEAADDFCRRDRDAEDERMGRADAAVKVEAQREAGPVTFGPRLMRWLESYRQESQV